MARAHRRVKVATCDWRHQCCRTFAKGPDVVWANCVGSFGVASAAYHWHRLMAGLGRSAFYILGRAALMQLVYVDDLVWLVGEKGGLEKLMVVVLYYAALGLPFAWHKFKGGYSCEWVGFEVSLLERSLGLSQARADWVIGWLEKTCAENCVRLANLRAVLGRLAFAFTALPQYRPFLGPLYAWSAAVGRRTVELCQNLSSSSLHSWQGPFDRLAGCNQSARRLIPRWNFSVRMPALTGRKCGLEGGH